MSGGLHRGNPKPRRSWRKRRQHPARILSELLDDASTTYFWQLSDDELVSIAQIRGALHRIADEAEQVRRG